MYVLYILWTAQTPPLPRDFLDHIPGPASFLTGRKGCLLSEVESNNDTEVHMIRRWPVSLSHPAGGMLHWVQAHPQKFKFSSTTALKDGELAPEFYLSTGFRFRATKPQAVLSG